MQKFYLLIILFLSSLFISCNTQDDPVNPVNATITTKSQVKICFDKNSIPENVLLLKATFTMDNQNPITANLDLKRDTLNYILIDSITPGTWKISVEGFDSNRTAIYNGESDVEVTENKISQLNLTLNPIIGSIYITLAWPI